MNGRAIHEKDVERRVSARLERVGFIEKMSFGVARAIGEGWRALVIPGVSQSDSADQVVVLPSVGVQWLQIEHKLQVLMTGKDTRDADCLATLQCELRGVIPTERRSVHKARWIVESMSVVDDVAGELCQLIEQYAMPWARGHASAKSIIDAIMSGDVPSARSDYIIPVLLLEQGRTRDAIQYVDGVSCRMTAIWPTGAAYYSKYFERLKAMYRVN